MNLDRHIDRKTDRQTDTHKTQTKRSCNSNWQLRTCNWRLASLLIDFLCAELRTSLHCQFQKCCNFASCKFQFSTFIHIHLLQLHLQSKYNSPPLFSKLNLTRFKLQVASCKLHVASFGICISTIHRRSHCDTLQAIKHFHYLPGLLCILIAPALSLVLSP